MKHRGCVFLVIHLLDEIGVCSFAAGRALEQCHVVVVEVELAIAGWTIGIVRHTIGSVLLNGIKSVCITILYGETEEGQFTLML